jgi:hypothetical protein
MKKNRDEPIGVIIHIYMEISQGNSLCSYLYLQKIKMSFFFLFSFFFDKIREQEDGTGPAGVRECWYQRESGSGGERGRRMNMVHKMCTHVCKCKMIPVKTIPGMAGRGDKGERRVVEGVNSRMIYLFDTL